MNFNMRKPLHHDYFSVHGDNRNTWDICSSEEEQLLFGKNKIVKSLHLLRAVLSKSYSNFDALSHNFTLSL